MHQRRASAADAACGEFWTSFAIAIADPSLPADSVCSLAGVACVPPVVAPRPNRTWRVKPDTAGEEGGGPDPGAEKPSRYAGRACRAPHSASTSSCRAGGAALKGPVHGGPGHGEQFGQIGDGVVAAAAVRPAGLAESLGWRPRSLPLARATAMPSRVRIRTRSRPLKDPFRTVGQRRRSWHWCRDGRLAKGTVAGGVELGEFVVDVDGDGADQPDGFGLRRGQVISAGFSASKPDTPARPAHRAAAAGRTGAKRRTRGHDGVVVAEHSAARGVLRGLVRGPTADGAAAPELGPEPADGHGGRPARPEPAPAGDRGRLLAGVTGPARA